MKVKLIGRKLYLPKELVNKAGLPENGECEAILIGDEVLIRRENNEKLNLIEILNRKKPVLAHIDKMAKAEEVDDD
jgi:hypothetical protein